MVATKGMYPAAHRKAGDALGYDGEIVNMRLRCSSCQATQTEPFDACASIRDSCAGVTCANCGRAGMMRTVRT